MNASIGKRRGLVLLVLTTAVLLAALLVSGRFHLRLDLSADKSQSLSKLSKQLYKEIPERVLINYYLSPALEERYPGPRAVRDLLREFEASSHGKISLSVQDPGERVGAIEALGVQPQRMQVVERNEQRVAVVYSGVVVQYLERSEVIPFVLDASTLEYDLIKAIRRAVSARPQRAALLIGDADKSLANDYRTLSESLRRSGWETEEIGRGEKVPPDVQLLIVLGNAALEDYDVYRIDEYLAQGGSVLVAAKGVEVEARDTLYAEALQKDALLKALASYGVTLKKNLVLDRYSLTVPFQEAGPFGGSSIRYVRYPHWIVARPEYASNSNPITARLAGLDLFWPSPLTVDEQRGVKAEILLKTSPKAWLQTTRFAVRPEEEASYADEAAGTTGQYGLAAALSGELPEAYAGKPLPTREGAAPLDPLPATAAPSRLMVIGSSDFATDLMTLTGSEFNASFIASAAEWLASGEELAAIKARGGRDPRLGKLDDPGARSLAILAAYLINLVLIPGGLVIYGLVRRRRRHALAQAETAPSAIPAEEVHEDGSEGAAK